VVDGTLCGMTAADAESAHHWPEIEERTVPGAGIVARARCGSCGWVGYWMWSRRRASESAQGHVRRPN
jgi:hypothetical protein